MKLRRRHYDPSHHRVQLTDVKLLQMVPPNRHEQEDNAMTGRSYHIGGDDRTLTAQLWQNCLVGQKMMVWLASRQLSLQSSRVACNRPLHVQKFHRRL